jgi:hypothetical protein
MTGNGEVIQDMNGDGAFDPIAEAISLLTWAFLGGPAPIRPCDPPELTAQIQELEAAVTNCRGELSASSIRVEELNSALTSCQGDLNTSNVQVKTLQAGLQECQRRAGLLDTGQTKCYDHNGTEVLCNDSSCPGQDAFYQTGCSTEGRFVDNGDGTVTDHCTTLMWQKDTADVNGDGQWTMPPWCEALAYCENLSLAGYDDWRLPNVRELLSIVDYGRDRPASAIYPVFDAFPTPYWSSSSGPGGPGIGPFFAWFVHFIFGGSGGARLDEGFVAHVRAVRNSP